MADKESKSVGYINHLDASYLQRDCRFEPRYCYLDGEEKVDGMWLAMLKEDSIFKSLHSNLASSTETPEMVAIQCIEGALREWWFYGKEVFDLRHQQLKEVVLTMEWTHFMSPQFFLNFEERETLWLENNECFL
jgi:hypothetical protein